MTMVNTTEFAERLKTVMEYYGLNAASFAETISVNRSSISHLLSGRNKPSLDFVIKVIEKFDEVELYWLLNGKGQFPKKDERSITSTRQTSSDPVVVKSEISEIRNVSSSNSSEDSDIEQIIIFYKDGSFKKYRPN